MSDRDIRIGVLIPTREAYLRGAEATSLVEFARAAADAGFDSLWAGDSLIARPRVEPLTMLAGAAVACPGMTIGTAALTAAMRHPVLAAHQIATLDQLSEGRLVLGLGAAFPYPETRAEFEAAGADFDHRIGRLKDTVALWRALWDPERDPAQPLEFRGRHWSFDGIERLPRPHRAGGPPLWLAGGGDRALQRAGRLFDGWLPYPPSADEYARGLEVALRAAKESGRDVDAFTPALYVTVNLGEPDQARAELERYTLEYYGLPLDAMSSLQAFYGGDVEGCAEWLRGFLDAGARHVILRLGSFDAVPQLERAGALLSVTER